MAIRLIFILFFINCAYAQESYLVMSSNDTPSVENIDTSDLRDIYLGNRVFWRNGDRIFPSHIRKTSGTMKYFLKSVLSMNPRQFNKYWRRRLFSGKGHPPIEHKNDIETLDYVKKTEGSLGIVNYLPKIFRKGLYYYKPSSDGHTLELVKLAKQKM